MTPLAVAKQPWKNPKAAANGRLAMESFRVKTETDFKTLQDGFLSSRRMGTDGATRSASEKTLHDYKYDLEKFFEALQGAGVACWEEVSRQHVSDYVSALRGRVEAGKLSDSSMWKPLRTLRALFFYIEKQQQWKLESFRSALPKIPQNKGRVWIPTPAEMLTFIGVIDRTTIWGFRDYVITSLLLDCGARAGEICNLSPGDIYWDSGMIKLLGKKRVERLVSVSEAKIIPLLRQWEKISKKVKKTERLFCTRFGGPLTPNALDQAFAKLRAMPEAKEINGSITPHTFRHFFATHYLVNGGSLQNLKEITGHEDLSTLMIYVHMARELSHVKEEHRRVSPLEHLGAPTEKKKRRMF